MIDQFWKREKRKEQQACRRKDLLEFESWDSTSELLKNASVRLLATPSWRDIGIMLACLSAGCSHTARVSIATPVVSLEKCATEKQSYFALSFFSFLKFDANNRTCTSSSCM